MRKSILLISSFCVLGIGAAHAQLRLSKNSGKGGYKPKFEPYSSVAFGLGTASYYGELAPLSDPLYSTFQLIRWNVTANYTRHFTPRLSGRAALTLARLTGDDYTFSKGRPKYDYTFARNLHFRNDVKEFSLTGLYQFVPEGRDFTHRSLLTPYVFAGIAVIAHNPKARTPEDMGNNWVSLQPLGTEGQGRPGYAKPYSRVTAAIPFGFGLRYKINRRWDVSGEVGMRYTFTDYLDDVGGLYADPNAFIDNPTALAMSRRSYEPIAARKGGDRAEGVRQYLISKGVDPSIIQDPFQFQLPGFQQGAERGGGRPDIYLLTNIHVNYILAPKVKCPPLR
jgi:hypothetical protein